MIIDPNNFLLSLANAMATAAGISMSAAKRILWIHDAVEDANTTADPYAVLRIYSGPANPVMILVPERFIQVMVIGSKSTAVLNLAQQLLESLQETDPGDGYDKPRCHWVIAGKKLTAGAIADDTHDYEIHTVSVLQQPSILGVDDKGRQMASFNFDVTVEMIDKETI